MLACHGKVSTIVAVCPHLPPPTPTSTHQHTPSALSDVPRDAYMTYCERMYMNPVTGTGPHWDNLLAAQLYQIRLDHVPLTDSTANTSPLFASIRLPDKV